MGKTEERSRVYCAGLCEESLIWFKGMPVVVGDEPMATGLFLYNLYIFSYLFNRKTSKTYSCYIDKVPLGAYNLKCIFVCKLEMGFIEDRKYE